MKNLFKQKVLKTKPSNDKGKAKTDKMTKNNLVETNITDERFTRILTDPKFREMPKKVHKVELTDDRFKHMMSDDRFNNQTEYDQYGKKTKKNKSELHKYYSLEEDEDKIDNEEDSIEKEEIIEDGSSDTSEEFDAFLKENQEQPEEEDENKEKIPLGDETSRLSVLNLDWDTISANDLFVLFNSFCTQKGQSILKVEIYPSEYGIQQMQKEKEQGPDRDIYRNEDSKIRCLENKEEEENDNSSVISHKEDEIISDIDNVADKENDDDYRGFDATKLRQYELQKLKYYYAIIHCDSVSTASALYNECDGMEFDKTQCFLDLRFVPDNIEKFPHPAKEVVTELPIEYDPKFTKNRALQHTKVKLTWDTNNVKRNETITRAFKKEQFNEDEINELIMSSDSEDEEDAKMFQSIMNNVKEDNKEDFTLLKKKKNNKELEFKEGEEVVITFNNDLENLNEKIKHEKPEKDKGNWEKYLERKKVIGREKKLKEKYRNEKKQRVVDPDDEDEEKVSTNENQVNGASKNELSLLVKDMRDKEFKFNQKDDRFKEVFSNQKYAIDPTHKDYKNNSSVVDAIRSKNRKKNKF